MTTESNIDIEWIREKFASIKSYLELARNLAKTDIDDFFILKPPF